VLFRTAREYAATSATSVCCSLEGPARRLPARVELHLLRIGLEAAANAVQHAQASRIDIVLRYQFDAVTLTVSDNGCGFDPDHAGAGQSGHFGLTGMRQRAKRIGARLLITSAAGKGTTVRVEQPA
jgi:signal transduction histidine kinase